MKKLITLGILTLALTSCGHMRGCHGGQCEMKTKECKSCCEKQGEQCQMKSEQKTDETKK